MAGKAYTMKEMKAMVEYLTEHKAFSEIKGRKMWMEFANSQKTTRTWQSLKETFIKRILPDLYNPYYQLTMDQVRSFKEGCDVAEKEKKNRLDIQITSDNSTSNDVKGKDNAIPSNNDTQEPKSNNEKLTIIDLDEEVEKVTGEGIITSAAKIPSRNRSSADTVVLENCYQNAEELQRDLESPQIIKDVSKKQLKDLIIFEPMTPFVQDLIQDFNTDSESSDKESALKIDESNSNVTNDEESQMSIFKNTQPDDPNSAEIQKKHVVEANEYGKELETSAVEQTLQKDSDAENNELQNSLRLRQQEPLTYEEALELINNDNKIEKQNTNQQNSDTKTSDLINENGLVSTKSNSKIVDKVSTPTTVHENKDKSKRASADCIQISGNTTSDTILPNNQEGLNDSKSTIKEQNAIKKIDMAKKDNIKKTNNISTRDSQKSKTSKEKLPDIKLNKIDIVNGTITLSDPQVIDENPTEAKKIMVSKADIEKQKINKEPILNTARENNTDTMFDDHLESNLINNNKLRKDTSKIPLEKKDSSEDIDLINPCLQSVSLYDEQFKMTKYSDSDSDDEATPALKPDMDKEKIQMKKEEPNPEKVKNTQVLESNIELKAGVDYKKQTSSNRNRSDMESILERERVLSNIFGYANGGASASRKRKLNHKRPHQHHNRLSTHESNSSEWTSESDSYVSPPRGRRSKHTRKLLKPKSFKIHRDPEEGRLFVLCGKTVYPLVRDGKHVKNLLQFSPNSDSDNEDKSFWRQKYFEERKKLDEYKQLLKETKDAASNDIRPVTPLPPPSIKKSATTHLTPKPAEVQSDNQAVSQQENKPEELKEKLVLKFATKNGERVHMEGAWAHISSAIPQVMQLLRNEPSNSSREARNIQPQDKKYETPMVEKVEISSGLSTPVNIEVIDPEVHEKVNQLETEIFKEIEEREKQAVSDDTEEMIPTKVTKRRGRPRKESPSSSLILTPAKRPKLSDTDIQDIPEIQKTPKRTRTSKTPMKKELKEPETKNSVPSTSKQFSNQPDITSTEVKNMDQNDSKVTKIEAEIQNEAIQQPRYKEGMHKSKQLKVSDEGTNDKKAVGRPVRKVKTPKKNETDSSASDNKGKRQSATKKRTESLDINFDEENVRFMFPPNKTPQKLKKSLILQKKER